jgi:hypothetical protein
MVRVYIDCRGREGGKRKKAEAHLPTPLRVGAGSPRGLGEVRLATDLRYNRANESVMGGARCRRQTLAGGVNEAGDDSLRVV